MRLKGADRQVSPLKWSVPSAFSDELHVDGSVPCSSQPRIPSSFWVFPLKYPSIWNTPEPCFPSVVPGKAASDSSGKSLRDTPSLDQVRDYGRARQNGSSGGRKKKPDSGNNVKVEPTGFPHQFDVDFANASEWVKDVSKVGAQVNGEMELPLRWNNCFGHLSKSLKVVWQPLHSAVNVTSNFLKDGLIFMQ